MPRDIEVEKADRGMGAKMLEEGHRMERARHDGPPEDLRALNEAGTDLVSDIFKSVNRTWVRLVRKMDQLVIHFSHARARIKVA